MKTNHNLNSAYDELVKAIQLYPVGDSRIKRARKKVDGIRNAGNKRHAKIN